MSKRESNPADKRTNDSLVQPRSIGDKNSNSIWNQLPVRIVVSLILVGYLSVVLLGPLSNPVGSEFLTRPLARAVAPIHRSLFLGHGYRFFGPDPGPSHMIVYRIVDSKGDLVEKRFPDRNEIWPRLMYHRWFMLSETLFQEHNFTLDKESFAENDQELARQIEALRLRGKLGIAKQIETERQQLTTRYQNARKRIDELVKAVAKNLLQRNHGTHIELFTQERSIPFPAAVLTGQKIDEPQFLSSLRKIGEFRLNEKQELESVVWAPEKPAEPTPAQSSEGEKVSPVQEKKDEAKNDASSEPEPKAGSRP